jgi:large subunit ribosomal protein L9
MELILRRDVDNVGKKGDVVSVRDGFGRNFLIARNLAVQATRSNRKFVEDQKVRSGKRHEREKVEAQKKAQELENLKVTIESSAGEGGKLFGSITAEHIREVLAEKGYSLDKKKIQLKESLRSLGSHAVVIELFPQVKTTITVEIIRKA